MSVRLFVLGQVYERDTYGYEIKATAHLWALESWAQIKDGSIYHALASLDKEQLIQEHRVEKSENNPLRYVYRITAQGRDAFLRLLRDICQTAPTEGRTIDLGLAFIRHLPPEERVALLKERHTRLNKARTDLLAESEGLHHYENLSPWVSVAVQHSLARIEAEIQWNSGLIDTVGQWPTKG